MTRNEYRLHWSKHTKAGKISKTNNLQRSSRLMQNRHVQKSELEFDKDINSEMIENVTPGTSIRQK